ncbi:hypothetical protein [Asticcacaulis benevestitus]|uniref:Uncharacterized protein n=1 Tax=Asticcacaulis benevestitus DSM 16100 = ATCC BAA-896 TaxID=1121022 RepID=V4NJG9_9CAUL|nr:hypothetical protein [Asticcacaulis benevestitus]ESQ81982.1 hypothetical protein ABENE_21285 [Asticcacaulis benevestitus DSM 16100 = ATCC BAA-896]
MSDDIIPITNDLKRKLNSEKTRTGISAIMLLEGETNIPAGLTSRTIYRCLGGLSKTASCAHLDYVLVKWAQYEDDAKSL